MKYLQLIKKSKKLKMIRTRYLLVLFLCVERCMGSTQRYKISMVTTGDLNKPAQFVHAESPVWDPDSQSLYFVDTLQQNVYRLDYASGDIFTKHIGYGQVNVVCLVAGSSRLLVAVRSSLYLLDWNVPGDNALRLLTTVDVGLPDNVINEGKADSEGRFWLGTKGPQTGDDVLPDKATLYSMDHHTFQYPRVQLRPVSISNGLTWSLNNTVMYYIDSPTQKIEAFDFNVYTGELTGRRTIIDISSYGYEEAIPDGMTIDSQGHLWVAVMFGGTVLHIDPDNRLIVYGYKLPVSRITSLCWGGPNLDELFVTSSKDPLHKDDPVGGGIFSIRGTGSEGVPLYTFRFYNADNY